MKMNALQLKWLIRIILKDLKIGVKGHIVLEAFHPDATNLYNFTSSLEEVCEKLNDPKKRINEILIQLFQPCYPMLGEKAKPNKIEALLKNQSFYIETKYDGERFQLHKSKDKYGFY
jgi:DNA ligase-4